MGGWIVLCAFHFEARAEEMVLGPFIPVMSSLPTCHSSICLIFIYLFYSGGGRGEMIAAGSSLNQEHFLLMDVGGNMLNM